MPSSVSLCVADEILLFSVRIGSPCTILKRILRRQQTAAAVGRLRPAKERFAKERVSLDSCPVRRLSSPWRGKNAASKPARLFGAAQRGGAGRSVACGDCTRVAACSATRLVFLFPGPPAAFKTVKTVRPSDSLLHATHVDWRVASEGGLGPVRVVGGKWAMVAPGRPGLESRALDCRPRYFIAVLWCNP